MLSFVKSLAATAATVMLAVGLIVAPAQVARAQEAPDTDWQNTGTGAEVAEQPNTSSLNLNGCWSGTVDDSNFGSGTGFLLFVQKGSKAGKGTGAGIDAGGLQTAGPLKGKIKKSSFSVSFHGKKCIVRFSGSMPSSNLIGNYIYHCGGTSTDGSFNFAFDASGNSC